MRMGLPVLTRGIQWSDISKCSSSIMRGIVSQSLLFALLLALLLFHRFLCAKVWSVAKSVFQTFRPVLRSPVCFLSSLRSS